jgi:hypothetical protein
MGTGEGSRGRGRTDLGRSERRGSASGSRREEAATAARRLGDLVERRTGRVSEEGTRSDDGEGEGSCAEDEKKGKMNTGSHNACARTGCFMVFKIDRFTV